MKRYEVKKDMLALREAWRKLPDYSCFWSSPDNPKGLQLTPTIEEGRVFLDFKVETHHSGFPRIAHGGVSFTILDGMMAWYVMSHTGRAGFTKSCQVQYFLPLHVGKTYRFEVTEDPSAESQSLTNFAVVGYVFEFVEGVQESEMRGRPLMKMAASFFLPDRKTAQRVLRAEFDGISAELFPER